MFSLFFHRVFFYLKRVFFVFIVSSCASLNVPNQNQNKDQPFVKKVTPTLDQAVTDFNQIKLEFSQSIDESTVKDDALFIFKAEDINFDWQNTTSVNQNLAQIRSHKIAGQIHFSNASTLIWQPERPLEPLKKYIVFVTDQLQSKNHVPFSQTPQNGYQPFVSSFVVLQKKRSALDFQKETMTKPDFLMIHEFLYDAQGDEIDGHQFIELYGTPNAHIGGYQLRILNGANGEVIKSITFSLKTKLSDRGIFVVADALTGTDNHTRVANADLILQMDMQNGPDAIQLIDPLGRLIDVVGYGGELTLPFDQSGFVLVEGQPALDAAAGQSLARNLGGDTQNNQNDFIILENPAPGILDQWDLVEDSSSSSNQEQETSGNEEQEHDPSSPHQTDETSSDETAEGDSTTDSSDFNPRHFYETTGKAVVITEVNHTPLFDWNDTQGGNGQAFDLAFGTGTVGSTDEWVEILNTTNDVIDLRGWRLDFLDGTDEEIIFNEDEDSEFLFSRGGSLANFQPDEFLVIGNPPGSMRNEIRLELFDQEEQLIDVSDLTDEATLIGSEGETNQRLEDELWGLSEATPGF